VGQLLLLPVPELPPPLLLLRPLAPHTTSSSNYSTANCHFRVEEERTSEALDRRHSSPRLSLVVVVVVVVVTVEGTQGDTPVAAARPVGKGKASSSTVHLRRRRDRARVLRLISIRVPGDRHFPLVLLQSPATGGGGVDGW
jgi:hypothetical protein